MSKPKRQTLPLPDIPMPWLLREEAMKRGYTPFAGFFLPHEYYMLPGFIKDLEARNRPYCGVRDIRHGKGIELFAKNNGQPRTSMENTATAKATAQAIKAGFPKTSEAERPLSEAQDRVAQSPSDV